MAGIAELLWQQNVQPAPQRNDSDASRFIVDALMEAGGKIGAAPAGIAQALMAPGNALRGEYAPGIGAQTDPRMVEDAASLAGLVSLGAAPIPRPSNSLGMGGRVVDEYAGSHRAPRIEQGATLNDPRMVFGDDIFGPNAQRYFGTGNDLMDAESIAIIKSAMDNPDAIVPIYRSVPKGVTSINPGDWVTTSKAYANDHGDASLGGTFDVLEMMVPARQLATDGNSIHEWGWWP